MPGPGPLLLFRLTTAAADPAPPDTTPPSSAEIADALSGRHGPVALRFRYEQRDHNNVYQADITSAVDGGGVTLDNERAIVWTAQLKIRPSRLPADFDEDTDHVAIFAEVLAGQVLGTGEWIRYQLGLYNLDTIREVPSPNGNLVWDCQAADVSIHLWEKYTQAPYTVAAGANIVEAVADLVTAAGLRSAIAPSTQVTAVSRTWPANVSYGEIANALLGAINYHPLFASSEGVLQSRERIDPALETAAVTYTTEAEPRMIRPGFTRSRSRNLAQNRLTITNRDASRAPTSTEGTNNDPDSPISTVIKGAVQSGDIDGSLVPNDTLAAAIVTYELQAIAGAARPAVHITHPDPRRGPREYYRLTVETSEVSSLWRVLGWSFPLQTGGAMQHTLARADHVDIATVKLV